MTPSPVLVTIRSQLFHLLHDPDEKKNSFQNALMLFLLRNKAEFFFSLAHKEGVA